MAFLRRFPLLAYLLVLLSLIGFAYACENFTLLGVAVLLTGLSWFFIENGNGPPVPRWVINSAVLFVSLILFWELVIQRQSNLILALGHFITGLILCKLFETKSNRDWGQLLVLSLLLILSSAILTTSAVFAMILVAYLALGLYLSLVFHLRVETQRAMVQRAAADRGMLMASNDLVIGASIRRIFWGSAVVLFVFAALVFVLFPRGGVPGMLANWRLHGNASQTGFSNRVALGQMGELHQSNAVVAEITLLTNGKNIGNEGYQPYFAGSTLDVYSRRSHEWMRSSGGVPSPKTLLLDAGNNHTAILYHLTAAQRKAGEIEQIVHLNRLGSDNNLFAMPPAIKIESSSTTSVMRLPDGSIISGASRSGEIDYKVWSSPALAPSLLGPKHPSLFPSFSMYQPFSPSGLIEVASAPIPKAVAAMAVRVGGPLFSRLAKHPDSTAAANLLCQRFETYLQSHYNYSFTMTPVDPNIDPTEDFLLHKQKIGGYCEYFASAMVMFCRAAGIPARMVVGYHGGDFNSVGGYYVVRQKFAHAWVQAYIPHVGWTRFDPSPAAALTTVETPRTWYSKMTDFFQWVRLQWLQNIVAFNAAMRKSIIHASVLAVKHGFEATVIWLRAIVSAVRHWMMNPKSGHYRLFIAGMVLFLAAGMTFWLVRTWHWRRTSVVAKMVRGLDAKLQRKLSRELAFFDRLVRLLAKRGVNRDPAHTPLEFVTQISHLPQTVRNEARTLVTYFYDIRYGNQVVTPELSNRIQASMKIIEKEIPNLRL